MTQPADPRNGAAWLERQQRVGLDIRLDADGDGPALVALDEDGVIIDWCRNVGDVSAGQLAKIVRKK